MSRPRQISKVHAGSLAKAFERGEISEAEYLAAVLDEALIVEGEKHAGKRVLSLDRVPSTAIASPMPERIAMEHLMDAAQLSPDERRYLEATLRGIPRRKLAAHFGWAPCRVEAVRVRLRRRLTVLRFTSDYGDFVIRGNSSALSFVERLPSGRRVWALAELGPSFPAIMAIEQAHPTISAKTLFAVA